ncbi:RsmB/NOP family class I SAM-dependent RNA methyltransferase [Sphingomonas donggukensis]|uniref:RsmB/NOP family class I SAM-dependent RNA methyltransferase n=1 Tax=Sphingomonas donggukensis TaxID=2949093 RepID=A0ABY4TZD4_9SPHN|nr:RsmB/NOP family class I SAM-dependent RNA methyltransferase [Sphingomonas donggukensis]URW76489.1 RsmB/NOP family class I SAM-dependent RNA methyltransferase [Sphingomonas donggukensis]
MTPAARTQSAIDLLDAIIVAARDGGAAADTLIARYFAARRYAGSKDRRAVRALVYEAIRLLGERPTSGRAAMLAVAKVRPELLETFDGSTYGPAPVGETEVPALTGLAPAWLRDALQRSGLDKVQMAALLDRAPLDIRVNTLMGTRDDALELFEGAETVAGAPAALRLPADTPVERSPAAEGGLVEIQDAGSQIVTAVADARAGQTVIDLCAGGGGKTLALAAAMANDGRIIATDTDRTRLQRMQPRADRAGVTIVESRLLDPGEEAKPLADLKDAADIVLIDAPCSGTGTWRRNPEARWRLSSGRLERLTTTQAMLLDLGATLTKPGGAITYIVCSLLDAEGAEQVAAFAARHPDWTVEAPAVGTAHGGGARLTPATDGTDGFFVARLRRPC